MRKKDPPPPKKPPKTQNFSYLWYNIKQSNIFKIKASERGQNILAKIFQNLMKTINLQIRDTQ